MHFSFKVFLLCLVQLTVHLNASKVRQNCVDNFAGKIIRVTGDWSIDAGGRTIWNAAEPNGLMEFDKDECQYFKIFRGLKVNHQYRWKVTIGNSWGENYGCRGRGGPDCLSQTDEDGDIRFIFKPYISPPVLATDHTLDKTPVLTTTRANGQVTDATPAPSRCKNMFETKVLRASGDWSIDAGNSKTWDAAEPKGLMIFDEEKCIYTVVLTGLTKRHLYAWKATVDNSWNINYGCSGLRGPNCAFQTNAVGAIRLTIDPQTNPPKLNSDHHIGICGNGVCDEGQSCEDCPQDCGECPEPTCGDGVCDPGQTFLTCPEDCSNELPNCERFNDESCKSGSQFHANNGVEKRRWQTPQPGASDYQKSFQHYYALVGYADIRYTSTARTEADVCIIAKHKKQDQIQLKYFFNGVEQLQNCKRFSSAYKDQVSLRVVGSDETELVVPSIDLIWNQVTLNRPNDATNYRSGQKGGIAELFGWPHKDVAKECEILGKAGYLGVKLFPVHEQLMSTQPFNNVMNPWYFMYQPVSYKLDGRMGTREELKQAIDTCRSHGVRVYVDAVLNHFTGAGNDLLDHRNPSAGCAKWSNKTSSAPDDRRSPFYTHAYTYKYNLNTGEPPSNEFPGAALGPEDFHCERSLGSWTDIFILNNGWLVGLTDLDTSRESVQERQAAYLVELMSMGVAGFRIDAAKHMSIEDLTGIFKRIQTKMGGQLPGDFFAWLEVITGGEAQILWQGESWYGTKFENMLKQSLGSMSEVNKIKMWDGLYPKEPQNNPSISKQRVVIQNDDHDQQNPGSSSRDMDGAGCVLVKNCPEDRHRSFETRLFENPSGVGDNANDWPIRFILSSYYHTQGIDGIPDGFSDCSLCTVDCATCKPSVSYKPAYVAGACAYKGDGYTRVHRDVAIINAMRKWLGLSAISGGDIGLPGC